jgi:bifunctional NMN adenylyltransferase/nudix hydrolase
MITKEKKYDIGVIIGRFQINRLHAAHRALINSVIQKHDRVIMFLGVAKATGTKKNPLDFASREVMIREEFGDSLSTILPLSDMKSDKHWSKQVDTKIREVFQNGSVVLYGSRDSFIPYYQGKFDTVELEAAEKVSASDIREEIKNKVEKTAEFRAGVIYGAYNTHDVVHPTVDIAIVKEETQEILLGRKPYEDKFRFVGGFVDVDDKSYEAAASRETREETRLDVGSPQYLGSTRVDDWRYRGYGDRSIMTILFKVSYMYGTPKASDDIEEVKWMKISELTENDLVVEHAKLLHLLKPES